MTDAAPDRTDLDDFLGAPPARPWRRRGIQAGVALLVVLLALFVARCYDGGETVSYATAPVRRGALNVTVSATGNLAPITQVDVGSELSGLITQVLVDNNSKVAKGQLLALLDTSRLQDAINQSKAALASAQAQVAQANATSAQTKASLDRLQQVYKLSGGKVPSGVELDTGRADYARALAGIRTAAAAVATARAQLSSNETEFSKASIRSPVDGVVLSRQVDPGQTVAASLNAPVLFTIAEDLSHMRLDVKVDEADVGEVKTGQRATFQVDAFPGRTFPATIARVDVGANATRAVTSTSSSGTSGSSASTASTVVAYVARLAVDNPDLILRPGMTATADIVTTQKNNVLLVPNAALRFSPERSARQASGGQGGGIAGAIVPTRGRRGGRGGAGGAGRDVTIGRGSQQRVYVLGEDGKPKAVPVVVGDSNGSETEVTGADIKEGMQVITGQLAPGEKAPAAGARHRRGQSGGEANGDTSSAAPAPALATAGTTPAEQAPAGNAPPGASVAVPSPSDTDARAARRAQWQAMTPEQRAARRAAREKERDGGQ